MQQTLSLARWIYMIGKQSWLVGMKRNQMNGWIMPMGKYPIPVCLLTSLDNVGNLLDFGLCYLDSMVDDWFSAGFLVLFIIIILSLLPQYCG